LEIMSTTPAKPPPARSAPAQPSAAQPPPAGPQQLIPEFVQLSAPAITGGPSQAVEADDDDESGSSYESGVSSETTSVSDSVFSFVYANGRRYHSDRFRKADYFMPNDETEQDRLDLYHHIFLSLLGGKLGTAPVKDLHKVLDVGTGTGIWAIDFADQHPEAEIIGVDISPMQPTWVPPNLKFEIDDMEEEWTFPNDNFDYIHIRCLSGCFQDWDTVLRHAFKATKPGGYFEFQDYGCEVFMSDGTKLEGPDTDHGVCEFMYQVNTAAEEAGRPLAVARGMAKRLEEVGFVDVTAQTAIWPMGSWPKQKELKELGRWAKYGFIESAFPFAYGQLKRKEWTKEQVQKLADDCNASLHTGKYYFQGWFVYGKKPAA